MDVDGNRFVIFTNSSQWIAELSQTKFMKLTTLPQSQTNRLIIILSPSWSTKAVLKTGTDCKWLQDGPCHRSNQRPRGCTRLQWSSCSLQPRFSLEWLWYRQLLKVSEGINDGADYLRSFEVFCSRLSWYKLRVHSSSLIQDIFKCTSVPGTADTSFNCFSVFQWASF